MSFLGSNLTPELAESLFENVRTGNIYDLLETAIDQYIKDNGPQDAIIYIGPREYQALIYSMAASAAYHTSIPTQGIEEVHYLGYFVKPVPVPGIRVAPTSPLLQTRPLRVFHL